MLLTAACGSNGETGGKRTANTPANREGAASEAEESAATPEGAGGHAAINPLGSEAERKLCQTLDTGETPIVKDQTFAINFEPYTDSCFITTHNPEHDDPPMESAIAIYRKGKKIYDVPGLFNSVTWGCWVDAVSFQDINADGRIDLIVIGKCQAKAGPYNENMVYANTGKGFVTNETANSWVSEMTTVREVAAYAKSNPEMFFK